MTDETHDADTPPVRQSTNPSEDWIPPAPTPLVGRTSAGTSSSDIPTQAGRFRVAGEIARGGMGAVLKAYDPELDREVAIKVLLAGLTIHPTAARRFLDEARIAGRLQHPGLVPVHDLGELPDGRPFFAMKLVEGRTLSALLHDRPDPAHDRPRFVAIFEQVCQAVAYAHSRGVIHRDLKPQNIMVGTFGEVQVMDWGLAKVLSDEPAGTDSTPLLIQPTGSGNGNTTHDHFSAGTDTDRTAPGSVLGTPAYMPPEQARGSDVDRRADVFALGGILSVILTGSPPYTGPNAGAVYTRALEANLDETFARLDACGAEMELVALCQRCLSADIAQRPVDAAEVAAAVSGFRATAEERARRAELERAAAQAQAIEQRRKRRWQLAVGACLVLLLAGSGAVAWWQDRQASDRRAVEARLAGERDTERRLKAEQAREGVLAAIQLAHDLRSQYRFTEANAALTHAASLAGGGEADLADRVRTATAELDFVVALDEIRYQKFISTNDDGSRRTKGMELAPPSYRAAFSARGYDPLSNDPGELAQRVAASPIASQIVSALDDWAMFEPDPTIRNRVRLVARLAQPGSWTNRLRDDATLTDRTVVAKLIQEYDPARISPASTAVLAVVMGSIHGMDATPILSLARVYAPEDFELAYLLGWYARTNLATRLAAYEAARTRRPTNVAAVTGLGQTLLASGKTSEALAILREAVRLAPRHPATHYNLASAFRAAGQLQDALSENREAVRLDPNDPIARNNLGFALMSLGELEAAASEYQAALRLWPEFPNAHNNLGAVLRKQGRPKEAKAELLEAIRLDPTLAKAHAQLGELLLENFKDDKGALAAFQEAVRLDPTDHVSLTNLGGMYLQSDRKTARRLFAEALRLKSDFWLAHTQMALALIQDQEYAEAVVHARAGVKANPKVGLTHATLYLALLMNKDQQGAEAARKEAEAILGPLTPKTSPKSKPTQPLAPPPRLKNASFN
jgi:Flp pilus assembly protein TadD